MSGLVEGVDFVAVPTEDLERAAQFYGSTLGLVRSVYIKERNYAEFETGNLTLSVIDARKMGIECEPVRSGIALHVADVEAARAELERAGVRFDGDTFDTGVCHMALFDDPDGNRLILHHRYDPRRTEESQAAAGTSAGASTIAGTSAGASTIASTIASTSAA